VNETFGIGIGEIFSRGLKGYTSNPLPITVAGMLVLALYAAFRLPAQALLDDDRLLESLAVDVIGLIACGTLAAMWYAAALAAVDERDFKVSDLLTGIRYGPQAVASFWFWAGLLIGLRLGGPLFGAVLAIFVLLLYMFHGFVIADGRTDSGLKALGESVRMSDKRRIALFALIAMFFVINVMAFLPIFSGEGPGATLDVPRVAATVVLLAVTTSYTMCCGGVIYRALLDLGVLEGPMQIGRPRNK